MRLIIGKHLIESDGVLLTNFDQLQEYLGQRSTAQETLECAFVYLLRLSGNYQQVSEQAMLQFMQECKREA